MQKIFRTVIFCVVVALSLLTNVPTISAQQSYQIRGRVICDGTGCEGAVIRNTTDGESWVMADSLGFYSITVPRGRVYLECSSLGLQNTVRSLYVTKDTLLNFYMLKESLYIHQLKVLGTGNNREEQLLTPSLSVERITPKIVSKVPTLLGEKDVIKVVQMLPGVQSISEGSSSFSVRGGSHDQNQILFDDANLFNVSHMMGFFSVFNSDAVGEMTLYKGDIPAEFGGKLSSLLDIKGRVGKRIFTVNGSVGLISSHLSVEGNMGNQKLTYLLAGRRTYADIFLPLSTNEVVKKSALHFYDLNGKINWSIDAKNVLSLTAYNGMDHFKTMDIGVDFGNTSTTLAYTHSFNSRLYYKLSAIQSRYNYKFYGSMAGLECDWQSYIQDCGLRLAFTWDMSENSALQFGASSNVQWFMPGKAIGKSTVGTATISQDVTLSKRQSNLNSFWLSTNLTTPNQRFSLKVGARVNYYTALGPTTMYEVDDQFQLVGPQNGTEIESWKVYKTYWGVEPRVGLSLKLSPSTALKASYGKNSQYVHLMSFSTSGSPLEIWVPSNNVIKPQECHNFSTGVFWNFPKYELEFSAELFYKKYENVVDFKDHPNLLLYNKLETELRFGKGEAYGFELLAKGKMGKLSGWVSYTYSRSFRTIDGINEGKRYKSPFDRPHSLNIVSSLDVNKRLTFSLNWVYATGQPQTVAISSFWYYNELIPVFSQRNQYRLPDYHRLDLSATVKLNKINKRFDNQLEFSVYNAYSRRNPWSTFFRAGTDGMYHVRGYYLFGIVPAVSWNFKF